MDGTRDRPPGKTAQNWSRKDGIRAGSVSGPWRSAPRETASDPSAFHGHAAHGKGPSLREAEAAVAPQVTPLDYQRARKRRAFVMVGWIAFGLLVASGIVVAALVFRPAAPTTEPAEVAEAAAPTTPVPEAEPVAAPSEPTAAPRTPSDPALAGVSIVRLRIGPDFPPERQAAILAALSEAGLPSIRVEPLPFRIATSRVGYYRAADLAAAEALGRLISPVIAKGSAIGVRDYGQLLADPEPGRLDLWVGG